MFDTIYSTLVGRMGSVWSAYGSVAGLVSGPLQVGMAINLMVVGYAIMRGVTNEPWGAYIGTWIKAQLAIAAATSSFGPWLGSVAWGLPDQLAAAFGGGSGGAQFDNFVQAVSAAAWATRDAAPHWIIDLGITSWETPDWIATVLALLVIVLAYIAAGIAMTIALFTKFALAVTIAVGPLFVAGLMFPSSSGMFFSWLGSALNSAINAAAVAAALTFVAGTVWGFAQNATAGSGAATAAYMALIAQAIIVLVGGFLVMQAGSIASFAGGGGASGGGLASAVLPSSRSVYRAAGGGARMAGRGAVKGGQAAKQAVVSRVRGASAKA